MKLSFKGTACNSDVTLPYELAETEDSTDSECVLYNGYINHFNFIPKEVSTTTSMPVTMTTTTSSTTKNAFTTTTQTESSRIPNTPYTSTSMTTTSSKDASRTTSSSQPTPGSVKIEIIISITCVSVAVMVCLGALVGVYVTIKVIGKLKRRRLG